MIKIFKKFESRIKRHRKYNSLRFFLAVCLVCNLGLALRAHASQEHKPTNPMFEIFKQYSEGGYADRRTVLQGDRINFYIANSLTSFTVKLLHYSFRGKPYPDDKIENILVENFSTFPILNRNSLTTVMTLNKIKGNSPAQYCDPSTGCNWKRSFSIKVPEQWPSGRYFVEFPVKFSKEKRYISFIVAERKPSSNLLFIFDTQTPAAYNFYAGGSFYAYFSGDKKYKSGNSKILSFQRPVVTGGYNAKNGEIQPLPGGANFDERFRLF